MSKIQSLNVTGKETLYVDIDDEITGIIDKIRSSSSKVVALVLPKRATVLQSVVNMKLLKRTADDSKKNLVLITSEAGLLPLAGSVGLHVASTPTSKPTIPPAPFRPTDEPEDIDEPLGMAEGGEGDSTESENTGFDPFAAAAIPVGELAAAGTPSKITPSSIDEEIALGSEPAAAALATPALPPRPKKNKKLSVPNFDNFRKKLLLGIVILALLVAAWILAFVILPKATVIIHTNTSTIPTNLNLTLATNAKALDTNTDVVPAVAQTEQRSYSQQAAATGQQNNGTKAQGTVHLGTTACAPNIAQPNDIPAGSSVSYNSHTYITQQNTTFTYNGPASGSCVSYTATADTPIMALKGGTDYNTPANVTFTSSTGASGQGSATGGTDNITKVVAQSDIDSAKSKISAQDTSGVKQQLVDDLVAKGLQAVPTTFLAGNPQITSSAQAGATADTVTVTEAITYNMLGVKQADLKTLVDNNVTGQLDTGKQIILNDGVANAKFSQQNPATTTGAAVAMQVTSVAGPQINIAQLKSQIAGKKSGDIQNLLKQTPGVTSVDIKYSPFWVSSTPKKLNKITILLYKSNGST